VARFANQRLVGKFPLDFGEKRAKIHDFFGPYYRIPSYIASK